MTERAATRSIGLRNRVRYRFDNLLSTGTSAALLFLGAATLVVLIISAFVLALAGVTFGGSEGTFFLEDFWQSMLRAMDPGTMADDVGWGQRLLALLVTVFGILVAGTLIGIIASGVEQRVDEMQRGRSVVVESDHVLILGASARLPVIVNQLTLAGRTRRRNAIVVLADRDPRDMNEDIRALVQDTRGSRLVFRRGDPSRRADLALVAVNKARFVVALARDDAENDAGVVKAVLAVGAELDGFDRKPIVAELSNVGTAEGLAKACGGQVHPIVPLQAVARIMAFTLGAPGLNQVIEELLDYRGCDVYVRDIGDLAGSQFDEMVSRFAKARPIGRIRVTGEVELNPAPETVLGDGDRLVLIADDGNTLATSPFPARRELPESTRRPLQAHRRNENYLFIGWNALGRQLLGHLPQMAAPGSSVHLVYDARLFEPDELDIPPTEGLEVRLTPIRTDTWQPADWNEQLAGITSVVFLGYRRGLSIEEADGRTLLSLMLLKQAMEANSVVGARMVAEVLDADNVDLARTTGADDFVVSDAMASRFIAQLAEQPERRPVMLSLFSTDGPSIELAEALELGLTGDAAWHEIVDTVYTAGMVAIGWRRASSGQVMLNPDVADRVPLEPGDQIVVIG
jgi:Trk K+ transport system NAD-binding subunit